MLINLCIEIEKIEHFFGHVTHSNYFYMFYNRRLFTSEGSEGNKCFFDIYSKGYYKSISEKFLKNQKYLEDIFRLKMTEITTSALFVLNFPPIFPAQFALLKK